MPRYSLELHWLDGKRTTGDYDSLDPHAAGDQFTEAETGVLWRVAEIVDAPEPFLAKLVCTEVQS